MGLFSLKAGHFRYLKDTNEQSEYLKFRIHNETPIFGCLSLF
jgi:hypothetical protein